MLTELFIILKIKIIGFIKIFTNFFKLLFFCTKNSFIFVGYLFNNKQ